MGLKGIVIGLIGAMSLAGEVMAQEYRFAFFNLPDLGGGESFGYGINELGHVAGSAFLPVVGFHATLWVEGEVTDLGTLGGAKSQAFDVNSSGEVVGWANPPGGGTLDQRAFLWRNGNMIDLGTLGGDWAVAGELNELGNVVGWSEELPGQSLPQRAFVWSGNGMTPLYALDPERSSQANSINASGLVVGQSGSETYGSWRAVKWENGEISDLGTARQDNSGRSFAYGVNDAGVIVGSTQIYINNSQFPCRWEQGSLVRVLGVPQGALGGYATAINSSDQIVGRAAFQDRADVGMFWELGRAYQLDDLLPPSCRWRTESARDINDAGQISGTGYLATDPGVNTAYLMSPVHPTLNLLGPQPGNAGTRNGLRITGATPGARITFLHSRHGGGARIPGCLIQTNALQLDAPTIIGTATANSSGVATITANVPHLARGQTFLMQAVVQGECAVSQLVVHEFE